MVDNGPKGSKVLRVHRYLAQHHLVIQYVNLSASEDVRCHRHSLSLSLLALYITLPHVSSVCCKRIKGDMANWSALPLEIRSMIAEHCIGQQTDQD